MPDQQAAERALWICSRKESLAVLRLRSRLRRAAFTATLINTALCRARHKAERFWLGVAEKGGWRERAAVDRDGELLCSFASSLVMFFPSGFDDESTSVKLLTKGGYREFRRRLAYSYGRLGTAFRMFVWGCLGPKSRRGFYPPHSSQEGSHRSPVPIFVHCGSNLLPDSPIETLPFPEQWR